MKVTNGAPSLAPSEHAALTTPLIVVSNRQPYEHVMRRGHRVCERTDGGLASALDPVLRSAHGVWVAWGSGEADREATGPDDRVAVPPDAPAYHLRRVWLTDEEIKGGYQGYANEVLWPLCHTILDRVSYRRRFWSGYVALNERFTQCVLDELRRRSALVWIHDFHLALVPGFLKGILSNVPLAFFWHVPWPSPSIYRILPEYREVLAALLQADSLVFQTTDHARSFVECARRFVDATVDEPTHVVSYKSHRTLVTARAISVEFQRFSRQAATGQTEQTMATLRRRLANGSGVRFGLGVDRLDYTKGLLKRLWALDCFFSRYPHYRGTFSFIQIAVPTRRDLETYRRYRKTIWQTVLEINARHGSTESESPKGWQPIVLLEDRIPFETLVAYYRLADLAIVSSVNDGMNLVAKEYVASQVDETGVLLMSHLAGAAEELTEVVSINPYDPEGVADSIAQALEMSEDERRRRLRAMREHVRRHDLQAWVEDCLGDARASGCRAR